MAIGGGITMRPSLADKLNLILENDANGDTYQAALDIAVALEEARRKVSDLERQLIHATDRLCGSLAMGVRRHQPGLNVALANGSCKVGYRSKHLMLRPDLTAGVWAVDGSDPIFARRFAKAHGPHTALVNNLDQVAKALAAFFTDHYRSLNEAITGAGRVLVDGRLSSIDGLAEFMYRNGSVV